MSTRIVEYDTILNIQTLAWTVYDTSVDFDRANHTDFDIHVSLLYDVGDEEPTDYTGIRVNYPADKTDRLGFLTPPASPRKFREESIAGGDHEATHQYIGNIEISPSSSTTGVKQTLSLHNNTNISEISVIDSPIKSEASKIFDATNLLDLVIIPDVYVTGNEFVPTDPIHHNFDILRIFDYASDDVYFDSEKYTIKGSVYLHYNHDLVEIDDYKIVFKGGLNPDRYDVQGIGGSNYQIRVDIEQDVHRKYGMYDIKQKGSFRLYLKVREFIDGQYTHDFHWVSVDYGFGDYAYMYDNCIADLAGKYYFVGGRHTHMSILCNSGDALWDVYQDDCLQYTQLGITSLHVQTSYVAKKSTGSIYSTALSDNVLDVVMTITVSGVKQGSSYIRPYAVNITAFNNDVYETISKWSDIRPTHSRGSYVAQASW